MYSGHLLLYNSATFSFGALWGMLRFLFCHLSISTMPFLTPLSCSLFSNPLTTPHLRNLLHGWLCPRNSSLVVLGLFHPIQGNSYSRENTSKKPTSRRSLWPSAATSVFCGFLVSAMDKTQQVS
ncbi:hypothetical protein EV426DRAFT_595345 [Tirmania nivea]|nr:hypothetical protein EV426DRAFT_595345 [Tirmania nivea]